MIQMLFKIIVYLKIEISSIFVNVKMDIMKIIKNNVKNANILVNYVKLQITVYYVHKTFKINIKNHNVFA